MGLRYTLRGVAYMNMHIHAHAHAGLCMCMYMHMHMHMYMQHVHVTCTLHVHVDIAIATCACTCSVIERSVGRSGVGRSVERSVAVGASGHRVGMSGNESFWCGGGHGIGRARGRRA